MRRTSRGSTEIISELGIGITPEADASCISDFGFRISKNNTWRAAWRAPIQCELVPAGGFKPALEVASADTHSYSQHATQH